jgi:hypothetical protein
MNYKTTGYSFSHSPNALALNGLQPFAPISSPRVTPLSFSAMPAQQIFDDNSEGIGSALAQGAYGLAKDVKSGLDADRAEKAELEKETRKHLRDLQVEKIKSDRTANYRQLQEDYLRSRISKTDKEISDRLDSVGVPKSKRSIVVDPQFIQGTPPAGFATMADKPLEQGDGENYEENTPDGYMDLGRDVSDIPEVKPDLPVADEPLPDLAPVEGQETSMLQGIKTPPVFQFEDFSISYQPGSLMAGSGGASSPATVALSDTLKNLDLSSVPASVNFVSPAQEQELYNLGTGLSEIANDADVQKKAQELFELKALKAAQAQPAQAPAQAQPAPTPDASAVPKIGFFWNLEDAWKAHNTQLPGYKKPKVIPHTSPEGIPFWEVQPPEPIEPTAQERTEDGKPRGKTVTATDTKRLSDFNSVIYTLNVIEEKLRKIEQRGPIVGQVRGRNPYDPDAQEIENLVTSVVPGLARGVFGEVGVLTDTDVARYMKLVPNIRTAPESARRAFGNLRDKVSASKYSILKELEDFGYDVSGKAGEMEKLQTRMDATTGALNERMRELATKLIPLKPGTPEYEETRKQLLETRLRQRQAEEKQPQ